MDEPRLLCIGEAVETPGWQAVTAPPWDGVLLASLSPAALLAQPCDEVCRALLTGKPVFLREAGLEHRRYPAALSRVLWAELAEKERRLRQMGVRRWEAPAERKTLTLADVEQLLHRGQPLPEGARLTPLARDRWEERI